MTDDEIIDAIASELKAPKLKPDIRRLIDIFRKIVADDLFHPGTKSANKDLAKQGIAWINDAEKWFSDVAGTSFLDPLHLLPMPELIAGGMPEGIADGTLLLQITLYYLTELRGHCEWALDTNHGVHGSVDFTQRHAAILARQLCLMAKIRPAWHDENGAYANITRLVYKVGTGKEVSDIRRALREVADFFNKSSNVAQIR